MFRLIFYTDIGGYGVFDSKISTQLIAKEYFLIQDGISVLCIIDYNQKMILHKGRLYQAHREHIDDIIFDPTIVNDI